jgi:hypothetical protein
MGRPWRRRKCPGSGTAKNGTIIICDVCKRDLWTNHGLVPAHLRPNKPEAITVKRIEYMDGSVELTIEGKKR